ncbi:nucleotidyltransferase domain-containing protein [Nocardia neocaledoniensis]|uniref:nucleotidyltransferase domain-containing protein n=1 Tax=Nocardia neocaledoniensis TaxID=236511 RepID=UPI0024551B9B|nr:nucleotidyltransferase domain-containing protein [Nocardia neocaledoniensis]
MDVARSSPHATAGRLIYEARQRRRLTQRELAKRAGVAQSTVATLESGRRQPSFAMVERLLAAAGFRLGTSLVNAVRPSVLLEEHRSEFEALLARYPVANVWLFGSVARGEDRSDSDLDLLVELAAGASVLDILDLDAELGELLGCPVDVVTTVDLKSNELLRRGVERGPKRLAFAA